MEKWNQSEEAAVALVWQNKSLAQMATQGAQGIGLGLAFDAFPATTLSPSEPASATTARTTAALALPWLAVGTGEGRDKLRSI